MAKHITSTGAFYGYISHGLGRVVGMAAGALTTLAYVVFEAALVGIFAFFASTFVSAHMGPDVHWILFAVLLLVANAFLRSEARRVGTECVRTGKSRGSPDTSKKN